MAALNFLGGLAGAYQHLQRGVDVAQARADQQEDRDYQKEQRGLKRQQQQRVIEQQKREDSLREETAKIPTTTEVDINKLNPETSQITVDNDGSPSATQVPAMKPVRRAQDLIYRDQAEAFRRAGDLDKWRELTAQADGIAAQRSADQFLQIRSQAAGKSAVEIANMLRDVYNNDHLPGEIRAIRELPGGGVSVDLHNADNGQTITRDFKTAAEAMQAAEAYFSPKSYAQLQAMRQKHLMELEEAEAKEAAKRDKLSPGQQMVDGRGRVLATNDNIPRGYEISGTNPDGSPRLVKSTTAKANDPDKALAEAMDFVATKSNLKEIATPAQIARFQALTRQINHEANVPPAVAAEVALAAALDPEGIKPTYDPKTGTINATYPHQGNNYVIDRLGTPQNARGVTPEQLKSITANFVGGMDESYRKLFIPAAGDPKAREQLHATIESTLRSSQSIAALEQRLGRRPSDEDIARAIQDGKAKADQQLDMIDRYIDNATRKKYAPRGASDRRSELSRGIGGLEGAPPELAARVRERTAKTDAARAEAEKKSADEKRVKEEDKARRLEEVKWLTLEVANALSPTEAAQYYSRYSDVLPTEVVRALRRRQ